MRFIHEAAKTFLLQFMVRLKKIEKKILELNREISGKGKELVQRLQYHGVSEAQLERLVQQENKSLKEEREQLEI